MLLTQVLSIFGFACYAASLTVIQAEWQLSNFQSGFLASSFFIGYVLVVPIATTLSDRIDTRQIYLTGDLLGPAILAQPWFCRALGNDGWMAAYASIVVWGLIFVFYTQYSLWKDQRKS